MSQPTGPKLDRERFLSWRHFGVLGVLPLVLAFTNPLAPPRPWLHKDASVFAYGGQQILSGGVPYIDFWDHKGPLTYYLQALGLAVGNGGLVGIWFLNLLFLFAATFLTYRGLRYWFTTSAALFGTLVYEGVLAGVMEGGNFTEDLSLPFIALGIWLAARSGAGPNRPTVVSGLFYGLCIGACLMLRPNNAAPLIGLLPVFWFDPQLERHRRVRHAVGTLLGSAGVGLVALLPNILTHSLDVVRQDYLTFNLLYSKASAELRIDALGKLAFRALLSGGFAILPTVFALQGERHEEPTREERFLRYAAFAFVLTIFATCWSGRAYYHYATLWTPFFAIFSARTFTKIRAARPQHAWPRVGFAVVAIMGIVALVDAWKEAREQRFPEAKLAQYVRERTRSTDTVLVWGHGVSVNVMSGRKSPTPYAYAIPVVTPNPVAPTIRQFVESLSKARPRLILDVTRLNSRSIPSLDPEPGEQPERSKYDPLPIDILELREFIRANYRRAGSIEGAQVFVAEP